jgi:uncharacterized protein YihD (DUF1040 family)
MSIENWYRYRVRMSDGTWSEWIPCSKRDYEELKDDDDFETKVIDP